MITHSCFLNAVLSDFFVLDEHHYWDDGNDYFLKVIHWMFRYHYINAKATAMTNHSVCDELPHHFCIASLIYSNIVFVFFLYDHYHLQFVIHSLVSQCFPFVLHL